MEAPNDGEKSGGKSAKGHGRRVDPASRGEALAGSTAVETTADAKQKTRRQVCFRL